MNRIVTGKWELADVRGRAGAFQTEGVAPSKTWGELRRTGWHGARARQGLDDGGPCGSWRGVVEVCVLFLKSQQK